MYIVIGTEPSYLYTSTGGKPRVQCFALCLEDLRFDSWSSHAKVLEN